MNDRVYTMIAIPNSWHNFYVSVRLWSAKGKAIDQLKTVLAQLDGYVYQNNDDLHDLCEWVRQHVEAAQAENRSKYAIAMDLKEQLDLYGHHCPTINVFSTRQDGDSFTDIATIYAIPIKGNLSIGYHAENCASTTYAEKGGEA